MNIVQEADDGVDADESEKVRLHRVVKLALRGEYQNSVVNRPKFDTIVEQIANKLPTEIKKIMLANGATDGDNLSLIQIFLRSEQVSGILDSTRASIDHHKWPFPTGVKLVAPTTLVPDNLKEERLAA